MPELPKTYNPREVEQQIYRRWEASGFFNPDKLPLSRRRKPFVISMPPSNITGELHLGHALGFTVQDALIRYHRMRGRAALWVPGTDHAAIATQVVVERELKKSGIERQTIGRAGFLRRVWDWKERFGHRIAEQSRRLGVSADWSRERFTMDRGLTLAVQTAFKRLYDDGLIYRGERMINWCPACQTAISDLEVDHEDQPGTLWRFRYNIVGTEDAIVVATTRPETMLGDAAVAVHPDDPRYRTLVGKKALLPIVGHEIPVIADSRVDREFGTGAVKVTPAHDALDFDLGQTHHLTPIQVIGFDGKMTASAGQHFAGLSVVAARELVLTKLREVGALVGEEDYPHAIALCSRSKTPIEPLVSLQWFVKMKPLAKAAIAAVRSGRIRLVPERFTKTYYHWLENIRDWNISRQIWWGHRLPVWYKTVRGKEVVRVATTKPGPGWRQDEDTLDTWFSSGLWTFSTLGWPGRTSDLRRFHPTDVLETSWDILFFWVARMIMFSEYFLKQPPFRTVYLHGLVLDREGKKMSRSKGNGIDPLVMCDQYGTDALRMSLIVGNAPGQDFRLYEQKIEGYRNFANKLWNIARYILAHERPAEGLGAKTVADRWVLGRLNAVTAEVTASIERYELSGAGQVLYDFIWHDFADWYLEAAKVHPNAGVLYAVLEQALRLLHPFMPYVTEAIWEAIRSDDLLMVSAWPKPRPVWGKYGAELEAFARIQETVAALRNFRAHGGLPASAPCHYVTHPPFEDAVLLRALSGVAVQPAPRLVVDSRYAEILLGHVRFQVGRDYVDRFEGWRQKERAALEQYIAKIRSKLANEQFTAHAPESLVAEEREKLRSAEQRLLGL